MSGTELAFLLLVAKIAYENGRRDQAQARPHAPDDRLYSESRATSSWGVRP